MRKKFKTMEVEKIQERWYVHLFRHSFECLFNVIGVVMMNPSYSVSAGKSCLKTSVMLSRKSLTHRG